MSDTAMKTPGVGSVVQMVELDTVLGDRKGWIVGLFKGGNTMLWDDNVPRDARVSPLTKEECPGVGFFVAWQRHSATPMREPLPQVKCEGREDVVSAEDFTGPITLPMKLEEVKVINV